MTSLKDKVPLISVGIAAIALAGYLYFSTPAKKNESKSLKIEEHIESEDEEPVPRFHFIPASLSSAEKEKAISTWVKEQILSLTEGDTLKAPGGQLSKTDFLILCNIVENRIKAYLFDEKSRL